ncbi:hypothetical protein [Priestia megaterium]|uniref:hypothetical protein n=1 Tax=Priestia megaterium TaxID=1404 RepID=UPI000BFA7F51|nr:hypothetical protein [Priestia megaterium]PFD97304.1 hypothetical protein CN265_20075 [Priestia megaterium]PFK03325.1 hypothetical protein COI96_03530 [Priestia megaterium]PMD10673.1 hypothetical protein CJ194_04110 [Priestia megaterium]
MIDYEQLPNRVIICIDMKAFFTLFFSILNANVKEEEKMSLLEDVVISVKEAYALAKTID